MNKYYSITLAALLITTPLAHADDIPTPNHNDEPVVTKDAVGFGTGALIGGVLAGPIGVIAGGAGGAWLGAREAKGDDKRAELAGELAARTAELEQLKSQLAALETRDRTQPVRLDTQQHSAEALSQALNVAVYFQTDSSELQPAARQRLEQMATYLTEYEALRIHVAGFADPRGGQHYNQRLSRQRAEAVARVLQAAGIDAERMNIEAHGQTGGQSEPGNLESYMFDRRVNIELSLTDPA